MVEIITLPDERYFLLIDGHTNRVMICTADIESIEFVTESSDTLVIKTFNKDYEFIGDDAQKIEEFLMEIAKSGWTARRNRRLLPI